jgi:NAD(P)-dependent dehydrogenase (short-subunit alcohol dehydrogenase family)
MNSMATDFLSQIAPLFALEGKVAFVTGGAVGMGRAAGCVLAAAGAQVVLADVSARIDALGDLPARVSTAVLDVTDPGAVTSVVRATIESTGGIDILVNGAVVNHNRPLLEITAEEWDHVQAVNLKAAFLVTQAVIPCMQGRGGGRIINITTIGSVHPVLHGNAAYSASRAGLNQLTRNCALDFAKDNITANAVLPGAIVTETQHAGLHPTGPGADSARHLSGYGKPEDVAGIVLLLAGPAGRYITGQMIAVDGGFLVS